MKGVVAVDGGVSHRCRKISCIRCNRRHQLTSLLRVSIDWRWCRASKDVSLDAAMLDVRRLELRAAWRAKTFVEAGVRT